MVNAFEPTKLLAAWAFLIELCFEFIHVTSHAPDFDSLCLIVLLSFRSRLLQECSVNLHIFSRQQCCRLMISTWLTKCNPSLLLLILPIRKTWFWFIYFSVLIWYGVLRQVLSAFTSQICLRTHLSSVGMKCWLLNGQVWSNVVGNHLLMIFL